MNGRGILGLLIAIILIVGVFLFWGNGSGNQSTLLSYNTSVMSFEYPSTYTIVSNTTYPSGNVEISLEENGTSGSNLIMISRYVYDPDPYGTGPKTGRERALAWLDGAKSNGIQTDNVTNRKYESYGTPGNIGFINDYLFEINGSAYVIQGHFNAVFNNETPQETAAAAKSAMITILQTMK